MLLLRSKYNNSAAIAFYIAGFLAITSARATTLIVIVEDSRILVAADSKVRFSVTGAAEWCKIFPATPKCAFAIVGLNRKPETGFNSEDFAFSACRDMRIPSEAAKRFGDAVRVPLTVAIDYSRVNSPEIYKRDYSGKAVLEGIFAGFENDTPIAYVKSFLIDADGAFREELKRIPDKSGSNIGVSGSQEAALAVLSQTQGPYVDFEALAKSLIESEIAANPRAVGAPIAILEIKRTGYRWVSPGKCNTAPK